MGKYDSRKTGTGSTESTNEGYYVTIQVVAWCDIDDLTTLYIVPNLVIVPDLVTLYIVPDLVTLQVLCISGIVYKTFLTDFIMAFYNTVVALLECFSKTVWNGQIMLQRSTML